MAAAAAMEHNGTPIDVPTLELLRERWLDIQDDLIRTIDVHDIYDGRTFKSERWRNLMAKLGIPWRLLESGQLGPERRPVPPNGQVLPASSHPIASYAVLCQICG